MLRKLFIPLTVLLMAFSFPACTGSSSSDQKIVYVDNANDSGIEDGSFEYPYTEIQKAIDLAHTDDDTLVYIRKGNKPYSIEQGILVDLVNTKNLTLWGSGSNDGFPGVPDNSGYPILQSSTLGHERPIYLDHVENIAIIGLDLRGGEQNVIYAVGPKNLTIKHCRISGAEHFDMWTRTSGILIYSFGHDESENITITNNIIYDNDTGGINISVFGNPHYGHNPIAKNILISGNTFYQTQESDLKMHLPVICEIWCGLMEDITIEENNVQNFGDGSPWTPAGIFFVQRLTEAPQSKNIVIRNNTIANSAGDSAGVWVQVSSGKMEGLLIHENTISNVGRGICLLAPGAASEPGAGGGVIDSAAVTANTITSSLHPFQGGLLLVAQDDGSLSALVSRNVVTDGLGYGVWLDRDVEATLTTDLGGGPLGSAGYNSIADNQLGAIGIEDEDVGPQFARYNWWGRADDPGSLIQGEIDYTPWLTEDPNL